MKRPIGRPRKPEGAQQNYNVRLPPDVKKYYKSHPGLIKKVLIDYYNRRDLDTSV